MDASSSKRSRELNSIMADRILKIVYYVTLVKYLGGMYKEKIGNTLLSEEVLHKYPHTVSSHLSVIR